MVTLKERFSELLKLRPDLKQADIARACNVKPPSVNAWFSGETKTMKASTAACVAKLYGVNPQWLADGIGEMLTTNVVRRAVPYITPDDFERLRDGQGLVYAGKVSVHKVKVAGMARLGVDGFFEEVGPRTGGDDGVVESMSDDPAAYALRIRGDAAFPAIRDGEYIVIEPHIKATPADRVVVVLVDGRTLLQELIIDKPESITVVTLDGTTRRTIQREEIRPAFGIQVVTSIVSPRKWSAS